MRGWVPLFCVLGVGCSGGEPGAGDLGLADLAADLSADLASVPDLRPPRRPPTDHPLPTQLTNHGGKPLDKVELWTVVWPGDEELGARTNRFHAWLLASDLWTQSLAEYGVGAGIAKGVIVLPAAAPPTIDYTAFDAIIANLSAQPQYKPNFRDVIQVYGGLTG